MCSVGVDVSNVSELSPEEEKKIGTFIESSQYGNIFQTIGWGKVCKAAIGCISRMIVIRELNEICGTLLFIEYPRTKHFVAEDGPVLIRDDYALFKRIYKKYIEFCQNNSARRIELHLFPDYSFAGFIRLYSLRAVKEIKNPTETIWQGLDRRSVRNAVKKAIKRNVTIIEAENETDYLNHLKLARISKIRGGCALHLSPFIKNSQNILRAILQYIPSNHVLFLAKIDDEYIASALWLFFGKRAYYYDVGLNYSYKEYNAPDYLMWHSIEFLKNAGVTQIDLMGVNSSSNSPFKHKWSDEMIPNKYIIWTRPDFYLMHLLAYPDSIIDAGHFLDSVIRHSRSG
jgi:hypothetical protein